MNKVAIIGNLVRDPDLSETNSGVKVCRFTVAVNRDYKDADGNRLTDFFNVTCWRGLAENVANYTKKGNKVAVTGSVQLRSYEDNNGNKHTTVDIVAQDVEFLTPKSGDSTNEDFSNQEERKPRLSRTGRGTPAQMQVFDDDYGDVPF